MLHLCLKECHYFCTYTGVSVVVGENRKTSSTSELGTAHNDSWRGWLWHIQLWRVSVTQLPIKIFRLQLLFYILEVNSGPVYLFIDSFKKKKSEYYNLLCLWNLQLWTCQTVTYAFVEAVFPCDFNSIFFYKSCWLAIKTALPIILVKNPPIRGVTVTMEM